MGFTLLKAPFRWHQVYEQTQPLQITVAERRLSLVLIFLEWKTRRKTTPLCIIFLDQSQIEVLPRSTLFPEHLPSSPCCHRIMFPANQSWHLKTVEVSHEIRVQVNA